MSFLFLLLSLVHALDPVCAGHFSQLEKSETLKRLSAIVPESGFRGFVNKTRGSYFFIRTTEDKIKLTFLTTGLFDLYGIRRDSDIQFCEAEGQLTILGLGGIQKILLKDNLIYLKGNSPVHIFELGEVPSLLREKNDLSDFE